MSTPSTAEEILTDLTLWRRALAIRIDKIEEQLEVNTIATERVDRNTAELVGHFRDWQGAIRVLNFVARIAKPLTIIGALFGAWFAWKSK